MQEVFPNSRFGDLIDLDFCSTGELMLLIMFTNSCTGELYPLSILGADLLVFVLSQVSRLIDWWIMKDTSIFFMVTASLSCLHFPSFVSRSLYARLIKN